MSDDCQPPRDSNPAKVRRPGDHVARDLNAAVKCADDSAGHER